MHRDVGCRIKFQNNVVDALSIYSKNGNSIEIVFLNKYLGIVGNSKNLIRVNVAKCA